MADNKKSAVVSRKMPSLAPITKRSQPLPALIPVSQASGSGVPVRGSVSKAREMPALCPIVKTSVKRKLPMDIKMQSLSDELSAGVVSNMMHEIVPSKKALGSINLNENRLSEPQILINRPLVNYSSSESDDDDEMENVCSDFINNLDDQDSEDPNTIHDLYPPMPEDYEWEIIMASMEAYLNEELDSVLIKVTEMEISDLQKQISDKDKIIAAMIEDKQNLESSLQKKMKEIQVLRKSMQSLNLYPSEISNNLEDYSSQQQQSMISLRTMSPSLIEPSVNTTMADITVVDVIPSTSQVITKKTSRRKRKFLLKCLEQSCAEPQIDGSDF